MSEPIWTIPPVTLTEVEPGLHRMLEPCDETCHHPVHGFSGGKDRARHLIECEVADWALAHPEYFDPPHPSLPEGFVPHRANRPTKAPVGASLIRYPNGATHA